MIKFSRNARQCTVIADTILIYNYTTKLLKLSDNDVNIYVDIITY